MKKISKLVDKINEEICGAKDYAEKYIEAKVEKDAEWQSRYAEMAEDELRHAMYLHEKAIKEIEEYKTVFTPPADMLERWEKAHNKYLEKVGIIKRMLSM